MCQKSTGATAGCRLKYGTYLSPAETKIMCVISRGLDYDHVRFESVGGSASENARSIFEATTPTQRMIIDLECHRRCLLVEREAAIFGLNKASPGIVRGLCSSGFQARGLGHTLGVT